MSVYLAGKIASASLNAGVKLLKPTAQTVFADLHHAAQGGNLTAYTKAIYNEFPDIIPLIKAKLQEYPGLYKLDKVGSIFRAVREAHPLGK